jgi:segregation and condensation protein B
MHDDLALILEPDLPRHELPTHAVRQQPLKFILEAAILAASNPLTIEQLSELFEDATRPSHTELAQTLDTLSADCAQRGVELIEVASGFRYQIKTAVYPHVAKLWTERQSKYSRALLETLSLIAYRQPITRAEIEAVRGVAVSSHIVRTLEEREWIRVVGHRELPGRPALFGTTRGFLDYFKLKSLEELPTLSEIKDLDAMAPELDFTREQRLSEPIVTEFVPEGAAAEAHAMSVEAKPEEQPAEAALEHHTQSAPANDLPQTQDAAPNMSPERDARKQTPTTPPDASNPNLHTDAAAPTGDAPTLLDEQFTT